MQGGRSQKRGRIRRKTEFPPAGRARKDLLFFRRRLHPTFDLRREIFRISEIVLIPGRGGTTIETQGWIAVPELRREIHLLFSIVACASYFQSSRDGTLDTLVMGFTPSVSPNSL